LYVIGNNDISVQLIKGKGRIVPVLN